jgi:uncharacterized membrane protein YeiB
MRGVPAAVEGGDMDLLSPPTRLVGLDVARFLALAGMVLVHAQSDLVLPPLERAAGGVEVPAPAAPALLELLQAVLTNRSRLLFLLLAGVGVSLLVRRRPAPAGTLLRRAGFLLALGIALLALGWTDLVLLFYAVLFVLAPLLVRLPSPVLLAVAAALTVPAAVALAVDPARSSGLTGVLLVLGEAVPLFCVGLVVGRIDLADRGRLAGVLRWGGVLAAPGLLVLAARGGLDVTDVDGPLELLAATTSTTGLCLLVLAGCCHLEGGARGRVAAVLAVPGGMPLTAYVGHALLFPVVARTATLGLGAATAIAVAYLVVLAVAAHAWRTRHASGPVEAAMRRVSP